MLMTRRLHEHTVGEVTVILTKHLCEHKSLTVKQARELVDAGDDTIYLALSYLDRVLRVYKEGKVRYLLD